MRNLIDYHIHTSRCGHASGEMEAYVERAIERGLREIGFSDHLPLVTHADPQLTMGEEELPRYVEDVLRLREKHRGVLPIKLGIEADFIPGYEEETLRLLQLYEWDYVIGSVHIISEWEFDDPRRIGEWENRDVDDVYRCYFDLLRRSAESGLFDIMAHCDLVKKFGHRPQADLAKEIERTAETFRSAGMVVEINTSGLRKPVGEMYPAYAMVEAFQKQGVPLVVGSDAHRPEEVGQDFERAVEWALRAGYEETVVFTGRRMTERLPLPETLERRRQRASQAPLGALPDEGGRGGL